MTGEVVPVEEPEVVVDPDGVGVEEAVGAEEVCAVLPAETTTVEVVCCVPALVSEVVGAVGLA